MSCTWPLIWPCPACLPPAAPFEAAPPVPPPLPPLQAPLINAAVFSSTQVGDDAFAERFRKTVNLRDVTFKNDLIGQVPCAPSFPACSATPSGLIAAVRGWGLG